MDEKLQVAGRLRTRDLMAAQQLPGVGPTTVRRFFRIAASRTGLSSLEDVLDIAIRQVGQRKFPEPDQAALDSAYADADHIRSQCDALDVRVISPLDSEYPEALLDLVDFPPILYVKGALEALGKARKLAVVGTRYPSDLGAKLASEFSAELSALDVCVVSGLAKGIDAAAHSGALKGFGSTIAVLAHGLDKVAPKSNEKLAEQILVANGALISEYEPGTVPRPPQFVARNRLQSGLGRGSVVVESGFSGGSIHQGRLTTEQKRLLFVVDPSLDLPGGSEFKREGGDRLAAEFKAIRVKTLSDILEHIPDFKGAVAAAPSNGASAIEHADSTGPKKKNQGDLF